MSLLDTFSIVTFSWPWEAFGRVWLVFEACSASLWTLSTSSIRPSAACLDPGDAHLPLKLQIQSNIPGLAPVKRSQNNPLRPKGATFCGKMFLLSPKTGKGWWHTNGVLVCGWKCRKCQFCFFGICQQLVWRLATLYPPQFSVSSQKTLYRSDSLRQKLIIDKFCESDLTFDSDSEASDSED